MNAIPLGRVFGVPVYVGMTALLILAFLVWSRGMHTPAQIATSLLFGLAVFSSILVHELGHAVVGRRLGLNPQRIIIHGFGGLCEYGRSPRAREGVLSSAAGPVAGLLLGAVAWGLMTLFGGVIPAPLSSLLGYVVWINLFWSVFNLLPMWPLDGGHVLWHGLRLKIPGGRAWKITRAVGIATALGVAAVGYMLGMVFVIIVAGFSLLDLLQRD